MPRLSSKNQAIFLCNWWVAVLRPLLLNPSSEMTRLENGKLKKKSKEQLLEALTAPASYAKFHAFLAGLLIAERLQREIWQRWPNSYPRTKHSTRLIRRFRN